MQNPQFFDPHQLARRWRVSCRSLERWRARGFGPASIRIGGQVRYPAEAVFEFERQQILAAEAERAARAKAGAP